MSSAPINAEMRDVLPLTLENDRGDLHKHAIRDKDGYAILEAGMGCRSAAAYIVHACNNFPRMVEALRKAMLAVPDAEHVRELQDLLVSIGEIK